MIFRQNIIEYLREYIKTYSAYNIFLLIYRYLGFISSEGSFQNFQSLNKIVGIPTKTKAEGSENNNGLADSKKEDLQISNITSSFEAFLFYRAQALSAFSKISRFSSFFFYSFTKKSRKTKQTFQNIISKSRKYCYIYEYFYKYN